MRHGIVLFTCDRGITPARAAEERGFDAFYVPEHTHIPVKRELLWGLPDAPAETVEAHLDLASRISS